MESRLKPFPSMLEYDLKELNIHRSPHSGFNHRHVCDPGGPPTSATKATSLAVGVAAVDVIYRVGCRRSYTWYDEKP